MYAGGHVEAGLLHHISWVMLEQAGKEKGR
jgi:hypothetical protein